jgi:hypothetical protein
VPMPAISDCGLRNSECGLFDCGLWIADYLRWRFSFCFRRRFADVAPGGPDSERLICHATGSESLAILPLPVPVIQPDSWILLITPVGFPALLPPRLMPAAGAAVGLPAITAPANEKHQAAGCYAAKQLSKRNLARDCLPDGCGQWLPIMASWTS